MDNVNAIPKITKSIPVPEYQEDHFSQAGAFKDLLSDDEKKEKKESEEKHHLGNDPDLGNVIDIDG